MKSVISHKYFEMLLCIFTFLQSELGKTIDKFTWQWYNKTILNAK